MGMRRTIGLVMILGVIGYAAPAAAQAALTRSVNHASTPQALGVADAYTASALATAAVFSNPAGVAFGHVFHAEGWYGYTTDLSRHVAGVAAADSTTSVAGGLGFLYTYTGLEAEKNNSYDLRTSVAMVFADLIALGVNLKYLRTDYEEGLTGVPSNLNDFSLDAGAMLRIDRFFVGVSGTNLTNLDHPMAPLALTVGGGLTLGPTRWEFDAAFDWSTYDEVSDMGMRYAAGGEVLLADAYVLRAGYRFEDVPDIHIIAGGVGYVHPSMAIDFGFQQDLNGERNETRIGLSFRYFVQ